MNPPPLEFVVRAMDGADREAWAAMRAALWPEGTPDEHAKEIAEILTSSDWWAFIAETTERVPAGFAELAIRPYANGCTERPVPFLEGIWVAPEMRRRGAGRRLLAHIESFVRARGFRELCSDALLDNAGSHAAHARWGFVETERVVYFRKPL